MNVKKACWGVVLLVSLLLPLVPTVPPDVPPLRAQTDGEVPLPVAGMGEHPRLLITQAYIDDVLQPRMARNTSTWSNFLTYIESASPEEDASWTPSTALRSLALAWLLTEDTAYANRAEMIMVDLVNRIETHGVMSGADGFDSEFMENVAGLALGYDWLYNTLTMADLGEIEDTLWRASQRLIDPNADTEGLIWLDGQQLAVGNVEPRWLWAITAVSLALQDVRPEASGLIDYARGVFTTAIIPVLDLQTGGAWAEGPVYGFIANWPKVQTALAWWTAAGENYFDDTRWWYDRLAYDMFLYHPSEVRTYNEDWGDPMHSYPSIIGDSERYHTASAYGRAQDLLLRTVFQSTEHGDWMDWFLRQPPDTSPAWMAVEEFLWRDPLATGAPPTTTTWYAPYLGHVFMRSNWTNDEGQLDQTATYVSFNAGDRITYHQFFDQGNFTIFHNGKDLVVRSGVYSGDGTSDHDANYYVRSIAANTILICDLAENFDGIRPNGEREVWLNDCGQRTMNPAARTAINTDYLFANWQAYDTGSILRFGASTTATYIRADITAAYNSTVYTTPENRAKVSLVLRELVYWRPGTVIVYDRVVTTYPSYTPMTVFHFQSEPTPTGLFYGSLVGESALYMQNMLPNSRAMQIQGYEVAGQTVNLSWGEPASNNFERDPYGYYRLEIAPGQPNLDTWFATVFIAQDASAAPPAENILVVGDTMRGVASGSIQVMFDLLPGDNNGLTQANFQVAPTVTSVLITGLVPNATYAITPTGSTVLTLTADDAGLIALDNLQPGVLSLALQ
ncbi:MAG TPA: hypothetical protein VHP83_02135 [Aggregatilineaceae bacterium]|nr:hypothetical protein [Aggregatilineaceae bacterium]